MLNEFIIKNGKKLRYGYTTGSCATAATKAAALMLKNKEKIETVTIMTPKGWALTLDVVDIEMTESYVKCGIIKDGGDDPDATHGATIYAKVSMGAPLADGHVIYGGLGVGRVTKAGISVAVGKSAINPTPMKTITSVLDELMAEHYFDVEVSVPRGVEIGKKTFNPKLGIVGGISIIGTSGIVEPMSESSLKASLVLELSVLRAKGVDRVIFSPGNYGRDFARDCLKINSEHLIKTSNFIGFMIQEAERLGFKKILWIGHLGKMVKVAGGIFNTHSKMADGRMEVLAANVAMVSDNMGLVRQIMDCITTDDAIAYIKEENASQVFDLLAEKISKRSEDKVFNEIEVATILFTNTYGYLGECKKAKAFCEEFGNA